MARLPRLYAPNVPQLAQSTFIQPLSPLPAEPDVPPLDLLRMWLTRDAAPLGIALHGWLLMEDRITLLATPETPTALAQLFQDLGRRIAARLRHGRVFEGRYRSALLEPGLWVLPALIWLESLPVQLGRINNACAWKWSSARCHTGMDGYYQSLLNDHGDYWSCGNTPFERQTNYRRQLEHGLPSSQAEAIGKALHGQWALGSEPFLQQLSLHASRRPSPAPRGRPRKQTQT